MISLLFRVGLESDLAGLMHQLARATKIWIGDIIVNGGLGFVTSYWLLGLALIGVSMVPRAEITMIVMGKGLSLGEWAVSNQVFAAMVVVSAVTSILAPIILRSLLNKLPETQTGVSN